MGADGGWQSYALPKDRLLAEAAQAFQETEQWVFIVDDRWQIVFLSDELRRTFGFDLPVPAPLLGTAWMEMQLRSPYGATTPELVDAITEPLAGLILHDIGRPAAEGQADPRLRGVLDRGLPVDKSIFSCRFAATGVGGQPTSASMLAFRIRDESGRLAGTAIVIRPAIGTGTVASLAMHSDPHHLDRMQRVAKAARRPAAILFADLEASSPLARRLPTAAYFGLSRRLVREADRHVVAAGGLVGRHVGDGVAAFFLAETAGSEAAAAMACIAAARGFRDAVPDVARRSGLEPDDVVVRMGLHWGATLYVGNITSVGRSEVTALGDEVNEAARIEACAAGGLALASKDLIERLDPSDADVLGINVATIAYATLGELSTATEKARRDAPAIAVCEI